MYILYINKHSGGDLIAYCDQVGWKKSIPVNGIQIMLFKSKKVHNNCWYLEGFWMLVITEYSSGHHYCTWYWSMSLLKSREGTNKMEQVDEVKYLWG